MTHKLIIDQGNSAAKVAVYTAGGNSPLLTRVYAQLTMEHLSDILEAYRPISAIYSTTRGSDTGFTDDLRYALDGRLLEMTPETRLPIEVYYTSRQTLGADRVAAAVAAAARYPKAAMIVIDAGTAVTADIVTPELGFIGGSISPGLQMRFRALHDYTGALPMASADWITGAIGHNTLNCIRAGVQFGLTAELAARLDDAHIRYGATMAMMTGRDATELLRALTSPRIPIDYEQHLVLDGLNLILQYNEAD